MDYDLSWMGLFKKGYKLQWRANKNNKWIDIETNGMLRLCTNRHFNIRYKHSIQS